MYVHPQLLEKSFSYRDSKFAVAIIDPARVNKTDNREFTFHTTYFFILSLIAYLKWNSIGEVRRVRSYQGVVVCGSYESER